MVSQGYILSYSLVDSHSDREKFFRDIIKTNFWSKLFKMIRMNLYQVLLGVLSINEFYFLQIKVSGDKCGTSYNESSYN